MGSRRNKRAKPIGTSAITEDDIAAITIGNLPKNVDPTTFHEKLAFFGKIRKMTWNLSGLDLKTGASVIVHYRNRGEAVAARTILDKEEFGGGVLCATLLVPEAVSECEPEVKRPNRESRQHHLAGYQPFLQQPRQPTDILGLKITNEAEANVSKSVDSVKETDKQNHRNQRKQPNNKLSQQYPKGRERPVDQMLRECRSVNPQSHLLKNHPHTPFRDSRRPVPPHFQSQGRTIHQRPSSQVEPFHTQHPHGTNLLAAHDVINFKQPYDKQLFPPRFELFQPNVNLNINQPNQSKPNIQSNRPVLSNSKISSVPQNLAKSKSKTQTKPEQVLNWFPGARILHRPTGTEFWQVHIENLDPDTDLEELKEYFKKYGNFYDIIIHKARFRGGCQLRNADIYFRTLEEAVDIAKKTNGNKFNSNVLRVGVVSLPRKIDDNKKETLDIFREDKIRRLKLRKEDETKNDTVVAYGDYDDQRDWRVQVTNMISGTSHDDVKELFDRFGEITKINISDHYSRFGGTKIILVDIYFKTRDQAKASLYMSKVLFNCRTLCVEMFDQVVRVINWTDDLPMENVMVLFSTVGTVRNLTPQKFEDGRFYLHVVYDYSGAAAKAETRLHKSQFFGTQLRVQQMIIVDE